MKKLLKILKITAILVVIAVGGHICFLYYLASADSYPEDTFLKQEKNKTAIIITAHDDDAVSMAGTISKLTAQGWNVKQMCFYQEYKKHNKETRKSNLEFVAKLQGMKEVEHHDIVLRDNIESIEIPWAVFPKDQFDDVYHTKQAKSLIEQFILKNKPSVIFTLDDSIGGYGHPDHILISQLITDYCKSYQSDSAFTIQRIYQAVFDPSMNERILKDVQAYQIAKELYQFDQTPLPTVSIDLDGVESIKKEALQAYVTEQNSLRKVWPFYRFYPAKIYFGIFNKEYYRVLSLENNFETN
jgi:LmbE family N-acetylglucosaminyl deacetylase